MTTATWQPVDLLAMIESGPPHASNAPAGELLLTAVTSEAEGADTVKLLLDRGADPNARMTEGETSLDWAIYKGDRAKIAVLEQYGAQRGNGPRREEIPPPAKGGIADARLSLTRSVARLLEVAPKFREQATCISCHHNAMPALAARPPDGKGSRSTARPQECRRHRDVFRAGAAMMLGDTAAAAKRSPWATPRWGSRRKDIRPTKSPRP